MQVIKVDDSSKPFDENNVKTEKGLKQISTNFINPSDMITTEEEISIAD